MRMQAIKTSPTFDSCARPETNDLALMGRTMKWVGTIALTVTTLWVLILGDCIATGQSREKVLSRLP